MLQRINAQNDVKIAAKEAILEFLQLRKLIQKSKAKRKIFDIFRKQGKLNEGLIRFRQQVEYAPLHFYIF
jgi:hypothetical protein